MKKLLFLLFALSLITACDKDEVTGEWSIPADEVLDGGVGKDGIPSVDNPKFSSISSIEADRFLSDDELVIGVFRNGIAGKAYPHPILDKHEIVNDNNDNIGDLNYAITYCPLTGTGISWNRDIDGKTTTFGVSGKLYNTNLIPYDRETDSNWSQMRLDCVNGELINRKIETTQIIETTWETWKKAFPQTLVMNTDTGFDRNYNNYPYGDYRTNHSNIIFPISKLDTRLPAKERVFCVLAEGVEKAYSIESFETDRVIYDQVGTTDNIIIGSKSSNFIVGFKNENFNNLSFVADQLPIVAADGEGNKLDLGGRIVEGPRQGETLEPLNAYMGYFFSFGSFYGNIEIYQN